LGGAPAVPSDHSGRLELAHWLTHPDHPLTYRVLVNRVWHHLFGAGLVSTVDNFGSTGERPSHPELLDYLALRFMDQGWSVKKMVREIVLSRTYQLATLHAPQNFTADPENTLFWRMNSRAVDAESLRDAMLMISGKLDLYPQEGSVVCRATEGREGLFKLFSSLQQPRYDRSLYLPVVRDMVPESLTLFDFANPSLVTGDRESTNVPAQSLYLLNNKQVQELSDAFGRRVYDSAKDQPGRIQYAFWTAFARPPTNDEVRAAYTFFSEYSQDASKAKAKGGDLNAYAWSAFCQALMASAEFRHLD
ncbi:MAG TPA: DUF1553 domain-containing protein, partial [Verrucomicrobium sp.]|nr:DUF1553 domain-containing protein [Verrucomicrobium sp.]